MNFRKFFCQHFGWIKWLYNLCDCQRYEKEPDPPPPEPPEPPEPGPPPKPPQPDYPEPIPQLHYGQRLFLWFSVEWRKNKKVAIERLEDVIIKLRERRFSLVEGFTWITSGNAEHRHLNGFTPYLKDGGEFDLFRKNPRYWACYVDFLRVFQKVGSIEFQPTIFMRDADYCGVPFRRSKQGIRYLESEEALPVISETTKWYVEAHREVYGKKHKLHIKPFNELMHHNRYKFWLNGRLNWEAVKTGLDMGMPLFHFNIDVSHSEGCQIFCNEPTIHKKLEGTQWETVLIGYEEANRANWKKSILAENHGNCIVENLEGEKMLGLEIGKWRRYKFSGDGGGGPHALGYHIPGTGFRYASLFQYRKFFRKLWMTAKEWNKAAYHCHVDFECFRNAKTGEWHLWIEDCSAENIDWELAVIPAETYAEIYE